jgi:hypothetical protein
MSCPVCGGSDRKQIAPNYWECVSTVVQESTQYIADPYQPGDGARPIPSQSLRPCGHRYHEGTPQGGQLCSCGTYAIGVCLRCSVPVCGDCSQLVSTERLCSRHAQQVLVEAQQRAQREAAAATRREHVNHRDNDALFAAFLEEAARRGNPGAIDYWRPVATDQLDRRTRRRVSKGTVDRGTLLRAEREVLRKTEPFTVGWPLGTASYTKRQIKRFADDVWGPDTDHHQANVVLAAMGGLGQHVGGHADFPMLALGAPPGITERQLRAQFSTRLRIIARENGLPAL